MNTEQGYAILDVKKKDRSAIGINSIFGLRSFIFIRFLPFLLKRINELST
jgi:hypothetical protein